MINELTEMKMRLGIWKSRGEKRKYWGVNTKSIKVKMKEWC